MTLSCYRLARFTVYFKSYAYTSPIAGTDVQKRTILGIARLCTAVLYLDSVFFSIANSKKKKYSSVQFYQTCTLHCDALTT